MCIRDSPDCIICFICKKPIHDSIGQWYDKMVHGECVKLVDKKKLVSGGQTVLKYAMQTYNGKAKTMDCSKMIQEAFGHEGLKLTNLNEKDWVVNLPNQFLKMEDPITCLLYTSPSPRDQRGSRMPSSA
eukprot:TRINITY_DN13005_c0_g1_i1.p2 TRINITY_DN13005_c0_g1~~TRINITY_DN13005_c0_g1_i1.p2  ORF type:complete len:129 (+),score=54.08 TRINITY_DN13005_c0_g1_i1:67-453(+)